MRDPSYVCNLHHCSQQCWILKPLSKVGDQTRNLMVPRRIHYPLSHDGTPCNFFFFSVIFSVIFNLVFGNWFIYFCSTRWLITEQPGSMRWLIMENQSAEMERLMMKERKNKDRINKALEKVRWIIAVNTIGLGYFFFSLFLLCISDRI